MTAQVSGDIGEDMPDEYREMLHRLEDFGADCERHAIEIDRQGASLLEDTPDLPLPGGLLFVDRLFQAADWLAIHFQKRVTFGLLATHTIAVLMGLVFILYSEIDGLEVLLPLQALADGDHIIGGKGLLRRSALLGKE